MVDMKSLQALFGGTFDPVHYGHLKPVEILANLIGLSRVIIMPNNVPPHRAQPEASSAQRKQMLELAIADKPLFILDERELKRDTASYTAQLSRSGARNKGHSRRWRLLLVRTHCSPFLPGTIPTPFWTIPISSSADDRGIRWRWRRRSTSSGSNVI